MSVGYETDSWEEVGSIFWRWSGFGYLLPRLFSSSFFLVFFALFGFRIRYSLLMGPINGWFFSSSSFFFFLLLLFFFLEASSSFLFPGGEQELRGWKRFMVAREKPTSEGWA